MWKRPYSDGRMRVHKYRLQRRHAGSASRDGWEVVYDGADTGFVDAVPLTGLYDYRVQVCRSGHCAGLIHRCLLVRFIAAHLVALIPNAGME